LPGWRVYFKGGWGSGSGAVDHQVALLTHGDIRLSVAVLTAANGSHAAGKATLEGIFPRRLNNLSASGRYLLAHPSTTAETAGMSSQTQEHLFWLIVATLALVGDYALLRLAARHRLWIIGGLFALAWPVAAWFVVLFGWMAVVCRNGCLS